MARRVLKILHLLGTIGFAGALAVQMILLSTAPQDSLAEYALVREGIETITGRLLVPSLVVCLVSGLLAIAVYPPFQNAGWVAVKAAMGLPMFQGTLVVIDGTAQRAADLSARAVLGEVEPALLAEAVSGEWNALWMIMALAVAQTAVGVWRPRFHRRRWS